MKKKAKGQCCALDEHGKRCRRRATTYDDVFRIRDHVGWEWMVVYLCDEHAEWTGT